MHLNCPIKINIILSYNTNKIGVVSDSIMDSYLKVEIILFDNLGLKSFMNYSLST